MTNETVNMITLLKQILVKEEILGSFSLATVDIDFYSKLKYQMSIMDEGENSGELENGKSMLLQLLRKRQYKIMQMAMYNPLTTEISNKLSSEEREYYTDIYNSTIAFKNKLL